MHEFISPCSSPLLPSPSWTPILEHVNEQFDKYLNEELGITRKKVIPDTRVHCCLYFIPPTGHRSARSPSLSSTITPSHITTIPSLSPPHPHISPSHPHYHHHTLIITITPSHITITSSHITITSSHITITSSHITTTHSLSPPHPHYHHHTLLLPC